MQLFSIPQIVRDLEASMPDDGELTPEQIAQIDALNLGLNDLVQSACTLVAEEEALAETAKSQVARLQALAKSHEVRVKRWKGYLKHALESLSVPKVSTDWFDVSLQRNSQPSVIVKVGVEQLPIDYIRHPAPEVDKQALLIDYKAGKPMPDGVEVFQGTHVRIR